MNTDTPKPEHATIMAWWHELQAMDNRGLRAELRKAKSLQEVALTAGFNRLRRRMGHSDWRNYEPLALVAVALAYVEVDTGGRDIESFARQLAPKGKDKGVLSELRFRRLIQYQRPVELMEPMIRILRMLKKRASVLGLAETLYHWNEITRRRMTFAYTDGGETNQPTEPQPDQAQA
ncbi:MAG: type I-E CRISPR-associated protein Cse2/CasB [Gammaproteobacteria bacterium]